MPSLLLSLLFPPFLRAVIIFVCALVKNVIFHVRLLFFGGGGGRNNIPAVKRRRKSRLLLTSTNPGLLVPAACSNYYRRRQQSRCRKMDRSSRHQQQQQQRHHQIQGGIQESRFRYAPRKDVPTKPRAPRSSSARTIFARHSDVIGVAALTGTEPLSSQASRILVMGMTARGSLPRALVEGIVRLPPPPPPPPQQKQK